MRSVDAGVGVTGARGEHLGVLHAVRGVGPLAGVNPKVAVDLAAIVRWVSPGSSWEGDGMGRATIGWRWTTKESISSCIIFIVRPRNRSSMGTNSSRKETEA